jgi:hypothetical protein
MKQTAVEWFVEQVEQHLLTFGNMQPNVLSKLKGQAKEMERDQIEEAFEEGHLIAVEHGCRKSFIIPGSVYYDKTFNTKEK